MIKVINGNPELVSRIKSLRATHYNSPDNKYKYFFTYYQADIDIPYEDWNDRYLASVKGNVILGYIRISFSRYPDYVSRVSIISFDYDENGDKIKNNGFIFAKDIFSTIEDIFNRYNKGKICFSVYEGNPAKKLYDRSIEFLGTRYVGVYKNHVKLYTSEIADEHLYELHRSDFEATYCKRGKL